MLRAIFWKEWRQQRIFMFVTLAVVPGLLAIPGLLSGFFAKSPTPIFDKLALLFLWVPFLQALVTGSMLFAGESESGTLDYLDACSVDRSRIWFAKMASALAFTLPAMLLPTILVGFQGFLISSLALEVVVLAAAASVFVRTTFRAIGATVLVLLLTFAIEGALVAAIQRILPGGWAAAGAGFGLHLANVAAAAFVSWRRFCRQDRDGLTAGRSSVLVGVSPGWLAGSLWMVFRRQWMSLLVVGLAYLAFFVWIDLSMEPSADRYVRLSMFDLLAPAFLLAIGCVFGWNVFALEQAGAERFLGDQRFPRHRLWLAKVGVGIAFTIVSILLLAFPILLANAQETAYRPPGSTWLETSGISAFLPGFAFGMLGLSATQFFGIHDRRMPVITALTLVTVVPIGAVWYAPIYGGAPVWQLAVIPILFLAASRSELRRWTAGRLEGAAAWIRCGLVVLVCFAWTGLILWQRTTEVPDVGEPFVAQGSSIETPLEQERNQRLATAAATARDRFDRLMQSRGAALPFDLSRWHEPGIGLNPQPARDLTTLFDQVRTLGVPDVGRDDFVRLLDDAFDGDWAASLRNELVDEPRRTPVMWLAELGQTSKSLDCAAKLFCLKSTLLLAEGKTEAALDAFATSLAIVRHRAWFGGAMFASTTERELLESAETMLRRNGSDPAFCRGLLALLNRQDQDMPSLSDLIKASYSAATDAERTRSIDYRRPIGFLFEVGPEAIRDDRLQRAFCLGLLKAAEQNSLYMNPSMPYGEWYVRDWPVRYLAFATPDRNADDWARILSHQHLNGDVSFFNMFQIGFRHLPSTLARRDALRLACAAALYRHDHGRDLTSLAELAPEYLPTLPASPFVECAFVYRRSAGETWNVSHFDTATMIQRTIAPGTGVIELTGMPTLKIAVLETR